MANERLQGKSMRAQWQMNDFRDCLRECNLTDLGFEGETFTWSNHHEAPHTVRALLDRACSSLSWINLFPFTKVVHEAVACSDHAMLWISLSQESVSQPQRNRRRFRFEVAWISSLECADVIQQAWTSSSAATPHASVVGKILSHSPALTIVESA
ncbi:UNVERIFIED_CONTAM: hypothetical protein Slati_1473900 [Sesamum latifolium]|uniref:Reverse transcriptase n=1 Tax=Sesamum latifolium TaxID=2727402 RepID=A0AAW2XAI9_9LAMI